MSTRNRRKRQAAAKPERKAGKAWARTRFPEPQATKGPTAHVAKPTNNRSVYVRELEEGGCLIVSENGEHRLATGFSPPEGEGWVALHDEDGLIGQELAGNRRSARLERKERAIIEDLERLAKLRAAADAWANKLALKGD